MTSPFSVRAPRHAAPITVSLPSRPYRPELHGLRGLALLLVVVFHIFGGGRISGGIDVFLAITGFLFTPSLLRKAVEGRGRVGLRHHFGRVGQRLLPPALVVLAATAVATVLWLPPTRWLQTARELTASILYVENWELITSQLDYNAAGPSSSPLQHFWSLSVQGQFHLVWPFVVMAVVALAMRLRFSPVSSLIAVVSVVTALSFIYSVWLQAYDQPVAYYHSGARLWELTLGGLAALVLPYLRVPPRLTTTLAWTGLAMIVSCGFVFDASDFPGLASLWPVLGLLLLLAAGSAPTRLGPHRLLLAKPLTSVADMSYALYLWHWPVLVFYLAVRERDAVGLRGALVVFGLSVVLAWLTTRIVEGTVDLRLSRVGGRRRFAIVATTLVAAGVVSASSAHVLHGRQEDAMATTLLRASEQPGAAALLAPGDPTADAQQVDPASVVPLLDAVEQDLPALYERDCVQDLGDSPRYDEVLVCEDPTGGSGPRVVMTGGSHVQQWWPAMSEIAASAGWELMVVDKDGCQLTADRDGSSGADMTASCYRWNESALDVIVDLEPDAVFTIGSTTRGGQERLPDGFVDVWSQLHEEGIPVLAVRDTVRLAERVPECLERVGYDPVDCGIERSEVMADTYPSSAAVPSSVTFLDMTDLLCDGDHCPAIVGNVIVYRDASHVTATYMRSLAPFFEQRMRADVPWLFDDESVA